MKEVYLKYIGANVLKFRAEKGLTQEQLAEAIDIEPNYLQKIEHARVTLSLGVLFKLAEFFKVTPQTFFEEVPLTKVKVGRPRKSS